MKSKEFGQCLRSIRKSRGLSLHDIERRCGISNGYMSQVERGDRGIPQFDTLWKLSGALGVSFTSLCKAIENQTYGNVKASFDGDVKFLSVAYRSLSHQSQELVKLFVEFLAWNEKRRTP